MDEKPKNDSEWAGDRLETMAAAHVEATRKQRKKTAASDRRWSIFLLIGGLGITISSFRMSGGQMGLICSSILVAALIQYWRSTRKH